MCFWAGRGGTITLCASVRHGYVFTVAWATVCTWASSVMSLYATDQRKAKIQKIVNWALFVLLLLYDVPHNTKWKIPLKAPRVHELWANVTSKRATAAERVSCHIGQRGGWCLLTFQDGQTHQPTLASLCGVTLSSPPTPPPVLFLFSQIPPTPNPATLHFTLNIFTFPDSETTVNSPCDSERNGSAVCVMWLYLQATPSKLSLSANVNRHQKKNNACWWGWCKGTGLGLGS